MRLAMSECGPSRQQSHQSVMSEIATFSGYGTEGRLGQLTTVCHVHPLNCYFAKKPLNPISPIVIPCCNRFCEVMVGTTMVRRTVVSGNRLR